MAVKVQLDGQALAALIGGDSAIEVELRHGVVEEFARHYLKAVASEDAFKKAITGTADSIREQLENTVKNGLEQIGCRIVQARTGKYQVELPTVVINQIRDEVNRQITQSIASVVQRSVQDAVDAFNDKQAELITKEVTARLAGVVCNTVCQQVRALKIQVSDEA